MTASRFSTVFERAFVFTVLVWVGACSKNAQPEPTSSAIDTTEAERGPTVVRTEPKEPDASPPPPPVVAKRVAPSAERIAKTTGDPNTLTLPIEWLACSTDDECTKVHSPCSNSAFAVPVTVRYKDVASAAWKKWCGKRKPPMAALLYVKDSLCSSKKLCERTGAGYENRDDDGGDLEDALRDAKSDSSKK